MNKVCDECRFCLLEDHGYSNWTVEGTLVFCLKGLHPKTDGFDRWYGEDRNLKFAGQCAYFESGEPVELDVDREKISFDDAEAGKELSSAYTDDPEIKPLLDVWEAKNGGHKS